MRLDSPNWIFNLQSCQCTHSDACVCWVDMKHQKHIYISRWALNSPNKFPASCFFFTFQCICRRQRVLGAHHSFYYFSSLSNVHRHEKAYESEYENGIYVKEKNEWQKELLAIQIFITSHSISSIHKDAYQLAKRNKRGDRKRWKERAEFLSHL